MAFADPSCPGFELGDNPKWGLFCYCRHYPDKRPPFCSVNLKSKATEKYTRDYMMNDMGAFTVAVACDSNCMINGKLVNSPKASEGIQVRHFFIYPPTTSLKYQKISKSGNTVELPHPSGNRMIFNRNDSSPVKLSQCKTNPAPLKGFENKGGFEIENCRDRLVFDLGFKGGNGPMHVFDGQMKVIDQNGKTCVVTNQDVIKYYLVTVKDKKGNLVQKIDDTKDLHYHPSETILRNLSRNPRCMELDLTPLRNYPSRAKASGFGVG